MRPRTWPARVADEGLRVEVLDVGRERLVALLEAALARDREGRLVAEDHVVGRVVGARGQELRHPLGGDPGDDLDFHAVLLLEGLDEGLLHHLRPAAAVAGDHEGLLLRLRAGRGQEGGGEDREQGDGQTSTHG
jgi:hypothetical protein